jgi:hypothetical protein
MTKTIGLQPKNGIVTLCAFCGEQVGTGVKYCPNHRTQKGRKETFDENVKIFKENKEKGYKVPETMKSWK